MTLPALFEGKNLDLIRNTVAKDCSIPEFDQFLHICRSVGLDPLRRQIYAFVFNKNEASRQMTVVTAIGGYRSIAERTGNYRPDEKAPRVEYSDAAKNSKTNPLGIVRCEVTVYKRSHGEWFPVTGEAYWEEYAPIITTGEDGFEWVDTGEKYPPGHEKAGRPKRKKVPIGEAVSMIDPKKTGWVKMPRIMIAKCAEANALRKAWPDDFAGVEVEEEIDRRIIDLTATELADEAAEQKRFAAIGGAHAITIDWCDGGELRREPIGTFGDKVLAFIRANKESPMTVRAFHNRNVESLKEYWAKDKAGALELKKAFESIEQLEAAE